MMSTLRPPPARSCRRRGHAEPIDEETSSVSSAVCCHDQSSSSTLRTSVASSFQSSMQSSMQLSTSSFAHSLELPVKFFGGKPSEEGHAPDGSAVDNMAERRRVVNGDERLQRSLAEHLKASAAVTTAGCGPVVEEFLMSDEVDRRMAEHRRGGGKFGPKGRSQRRGINNLFTDLAKNWTIPRTTPNQVSEASDRGYASFSGFGESSLSNLGPPPLWGPGAPTPSDRVKSSMFQIRCDEPDQDAVDNQRNIAPVGRMGSFRFGNDEIKEEFWVEPSNAGLGDSFLLNPSFKAECNSLDDSDVDCENTSEGSGPKPARTNDGRWATAQGMRDEFLSRKAKYLALGLGRAFRRMPSASSSTSTPSNVEENFGGVDGDGDESQGSPEGVQVLDSMLQRRRSSHQSDCSLGLEEVFIGRDVSEPPHTPQPRAPAPTAQTIPALDLSAKAPVSKEEANVTSRGSPLHPPPSLPLDDNQGPKAGVSECSKGKGPNIDADKNSDEDEDSKALEASTLSGRYSWVPWPEVSDDFSSESSGNSGINSEDNAVDRSDRGKMCMSQEHCDQQGSPVRIMALCSGMKPDAATSGG